MFLRLPSRPTREQHELSSYLFVSVSVFHGSNEEPDSFVGSQIPASLLSGRCRSRPTADDFPHLEPPQHLQARSPFRPRAKRALLRTSRQAARGAPGRPSARPSNSPFNLLRSGLRSEEHTSELQ